MALTDVFAVSENTQRGIRTGDYTMTYASDDIYEQLQEARVATLVNLNHTWTFQVPVGSKVWLHHESHRTENEANEAFFYYAEAGTSGSQWAGQVYDTADPNGDYSYALSTSMNGTVLVRINDAIPVESVPLQDTVSVDQLWIRVVP